MLSFTHIIHNTYRILYIQILLELKLNTSNTCDIIFEQKLYKQTVFVLQFHFH